MLATTRLENSRSTQMKITPVRFTVHLDQYDIAFLDAGTNATRDTLLTVALQPGLEELKVLAEHRIKPLTK